tara:strand:+ start:4578 stop:6395 length:1818 start_codon:yes stop_codon:yes gene_type:complete
MTYIPKSQLTIKKSDGNEFKYQISSEPFEGFYMETSKGIRYAGTNNLYPGPIIIPLPIISNKIQGSSKDIKRFNIIKKSIKDFLLNTIPIPSMKKYPSEKDYDNGYFTRYFSRRINKDGYQEIDKDVFKSVKGKNQKYDYNLYEVGSIRWELKGNVFKLNALALKTKEREFKNISYLFPIFDEFAKEPFQNQENLYTEGGELYYGDSTEYIGAYHIHTTRGPMIGAYHTEVNHDKLYYTDELPVPPNTSYEDFLNSIIPPEIIPIEPVDPRDPRENESNNVRNVLPSPESYNCIVLWGPPPPNFQGLTREDGMVPIGSNCIDPGNGSGLYNMSADYGYGPINGDLLYACQTGCEGLTTSTNDTSGGVGCMIPWDTNYCEMCTIHDLILCAGSYNTSGGQTGGGSSGGMGGGSGTATFEGDCFTGETLIIMEDGSNKRIDEVIVGDIVKSEITTSKVISIDTHKEKDYTIYSLNNKKAFVTEEHPFKTTTGWKAINPLETFKIHGIESNTLKVGDILITKGGTEELKSINQSTTTIATVYNLRLDNEHVYYANNYLVHNGKELGGFNLPGLDDDDWDWNVLAEETCPCGMFGGVILYAPCCCNESC